jgi:predicted nucleic acid-binding protein
MIVVADTSPINYLILVGEINVLTKIFVTITIPRAVRDELMRPSSPEVVRDWIAQSPAWLQIREPSTLPDDSLAALDLGERDAIMLAIELRADQLIVDDREGRREAQMRGIPVMGTLGILRLASSAGLLNLRSVVKKLEATNFYIAPAVLKRLLDD